MRTDLPRLLSERLRRPLPGPMIGSRFAPQPHAHAFIDADIANDSASFSQIRLEKPNLRGLPSAKRFSDCAGLNNEKPNEAPKPAAVMILLYPDEERWHIPFIVRSEDRTVHSGQVSLPGGAIEAEETSAEAAVRELHEEIGGDDCEVELLGALSPWHIYVSNYLVTPWVGVASKRPSFRANPSEVASILEIPLEHLLNPANLKRSERTHAGKNYTTPFFSWREFRIWGATCMILGEFVTLVEEIVGG